MTTKRLSQRARWAGGQPISYLMQRALENPELISLAAGFVDQEALPVDATRTAIEAVLADPRRARAALQYGSTPGYPVLRELIVEQHAKADGRSAAEMDISADDVVLTAGSNQMLHTLADTLFDPGDIVLCAAPTYFVYLGVLRNLGVRAIGVASDDEGLIPEAADEALRKIERAGELHRVRAIYVVSYFDNPSTATLSLERRPQVVELARRWSRSGKIYVIEDAAYRELRYDGSDLPSLRAFDPDGQTVLLTHTFSKSFSPGLRVGWGILPEAVRGPVCEQKGNFDFGSPHFSQHVMAAVLELGLFEPQLARLRTAYREKRAAMLGALDEFMAHIPGVRWRRPEGGLYVWLHVPPQISTGPDGPLFERALAEGVLYVPGEYGFAPEGEAVGKHTMRLSFGVQRPERIARGIAGLARALESCL